MSRIIVVCFLLLISFSSNSQRSFWTNADTINPIRFTGVSSGIGSVWIGSTIGLSRVWYSGVEKSPWHTFDDSRNWLQMDKAGHFYAAYKLNQLSTELYRWSGAKKSTSLWMGLGVSVGYQTTFEMLDAYSSAWGFSWSDVAANSAGSFIYSGQQLLWDEERIIPKFSYHPTEFASIRPEVLGSSFSESLLKDYNGQTYWLSFSPGAFMKDSKIPKWACISLGYSAHSKLKGDSEIYLDEVTGNSYISQREFILSLDIDFSKLPIKKPWLKAIVKQFNYVKIPFPALVLRGGNATGNLLYF